MNIKLFPFVFIGFLFLAAACAEVGPKPKKIKVPELTGFSYFALDSGMTISIDFREKLELDSINVRFAVVTSEETGEGTTISQTLKTTGKKLEIRIPRSYFSDKDFYSAMVAGQFQYPVKLFRIEASPTHGELIIEQGKQKIHTKGKGVYFDQRVEKRSDGYSMTSSFDENNKLSLLYYN